MASDTTNRFIPISRQSDVASAALLSLNAPSPPIFCNRDIPYKHCACKGRIPRSCPIIEAMR
jgi:hypothetical protein